MLLLTGRYESELSAGELLEPRSRCQCSRARCNVKEEVQEKAEKGREDVGGEDSERKKRKRKRLNASRYRERTKAVISEWLVRRDQQILGQDLLKTCPEALRAGASSRRGEGGVNGK